MSIDEKVMEILQGLSGRETVRVCEHLQNDLGLDSLGMVTLLIELEETFHIKLDESDMNPFDLTTVADVVRLVNKY